MKKPWKDVGDGCTLLSAYHENGLKYPRFDRQREMELADAMRDSPDRAERELARELLILSCIPFAISLAMRYERPGMENGDLVQIAMLGLIKAVDGFRPREHGTRLTTYATDAIRNTMQNELNLQAYTITLPRNEKVLTAKSRDKIKKVRRGVLSLDMSFDEKGDDSFGLYEVMKTDDADHWGPTCLDDDFDEKDEIAVWSAFLKTEAPRLLSEREQKVLEMRRLGWTLEKIGNRFGMSKERVRQLLDRASIRLRGEWERKAKGVA